jgi:RNA polymerase sigma-70 factor (ECF subfamily)
VERSGGAEQADRIVSTADLELIQRLRGGDEVAFAELIDRHQSAMLRLAMNYVSTPTEAEEVVQETWLAVIEGLDRFEGRSSLKTWIFRILMNRAISRSHRERRNVPFSAVFKAEEEPEPAVDPSRFQGSKDGFPGGWVRFPNPWTSIPEERLLSNETMGVLEEVILDLPPAQREVLVMRDIDGMTSAETCNVLGVTETNQRVLLHRARNRARRALERYFDPLDEIGQAGKAPHEL